MKVIVSSESALDIKADCLIHFTAKSEMVKDPFLKSLDTATDGSVGALFDSLEFTGREGQLVTLNPVPGFTARRVHAKLCLSLVGQNREGLLINDKVEAASAQITLIRQVSNIAEAVSLPRRDFTPTALSAKAVQVSGHNTLMRYLLPAGSIPVLCLKRKGNGSYFQRIPGQVGQLLPVWTHGEIFLVTENQVVFFSEIKFINRVQTVGVGARQDFCQRRVESHQ